ncbi:TIGR02285 family protein [Curvibacter sp. APW13]|uniref:TIGR02285 family protein n=1 Tax=Curvibacter sp. APW13 TaxID=3077236 RepID=UPI0028E01745|nr:TIGR02285 family protein [Curvibacter sp. APW13]MDT8992169.1 TIGR02285 family protein [Curvibacter sp. APW13]
MFLSFRASCLAALLWIGLAGGALADPPLVRWLVLDFPPYHMVAGTQQELGLRDKYLRALQSDLPQFRHSTEFASVARMSGLMQAAEPVCTLSQLKTPEREAYALFARRPYGHQLPVRLITHPHTVARNIALQQEPVSLRRLLTSTSLTLGLVEKRRFGTALDELLENELSKQVVRFSSDTLLPAQIKLMEHGRFDLTLGYALEVEWLRQHDPKVKPVVYLPLAESDVLIPVYVSCARGETGEAVMAAVNALPPNSVAQQTLKREYEAMLPKPERSRYRKLVERLGDN